MIRFPSVCLLLALAWLGSGCRGLPAKPTLVDPRGYVSVSSPIITRVDAEARGRPDSRFVPFRFACDVCIEPEFYNRLDTDEARVELVLGDTEADARVTRIEASAATANRNAIRVRIPRDTGTRFVYARIELPRRLADAIDATCNARLVVYARGRTHTSDPIRVPVPGPTRAPSPPTLGPTLASTPKPTPPPDPAVLRAQRALDAARDARAAIKVELDRLLATHADRSDILDALRREGEAERAIERATAALRSAGERPTR